MLAAFPTISSKNRETSSHIVLQSVKSIFRCIPDEKKGSKKNKNLKNVGLNQFSKKIIPLKINLIYRCTLLGATPGPGFSNILVPRLDSHEIPIQCHIDHTVSHLLS